MSCEQEQQDVDDLEALLSDLHASLEDAPPNQRSHIIAQIHAAQNAPPRRLAEASPVPGRRPAAAPASPSSR
jgi:hypothetical protein